MKTFVWRTSILLILFCTECKQQETRTDKYFDFDGFIGDQIEGLTQAGRVLDKTSNMGKTPSDTTYLPSAKGWEDEMDIFRGLEIINKPAYRNVYKVQDPVKDLKSNLKIRQLSAEEMPVTELRFYYQDEFERLRKIEAVVSDHNLLVTSRRILVMEFEEEDSRPVLVRYSVNGFQKMILSDTVRFSVAGEIDL